MNMEIPILLFWPWLLATVGPAALGLLLAFLICHPDKPVTAGIWFRCSLVFLCMEVLHNLTKLGYIKWT